MTQLALFDLDHTLLPVDSDHEWGRFLVKIGVVDSDHYARENERFYADYKAGRLDIYGFLAFALKPLSEHSREQLNIWHQQFMQEIILPNLRQSALDLVKKHQDQGDLCCVVTATNSFVTKPIVKAFGINNLVATEPEVIGNPETGNFSGKVSGIPNFREGKITRVENWLASKNLNWDSFNDSYFYSDSINDLPLMEKVKQPIPTNPDERLKQEAIERAWPILELFA
ncbi:HAD family hydrolase [Polynucleobacter sp. MWH-Spelu-300-X4]|jgi:HAD superfamily hydrolase (TIGR01490 family)|uniref:histidinol-phosphatase n=1 Tax=Polynucleobacter sp. MWH-Spelu-300-X4 TaxID=2689109 RepID=UPI001BFE85E5|nr:HAD family hydrolase [Polynucleobacter sp. MWH-Spelu-300-X4]QWD79512.1 HAD family hydrolase [Polynucleobacter sp. MWH-Spelu-300-X4]